jgi:hypothetical protein
LIAYESKNKKVGYIAMEVVDSIFHSNADKYARIHLKRNQVVHSDALSALNIIDQTQHYKARVTPSYLVDECLPWVHIASEI